KTVVPWLVPHDPQQNAKRVRVIDAQQVVAVIGGERLGRTQGGPEADRLPVVAFRVFANSLRIRWAAVRVGNPGGRFGRPTCTAAVEIGTVVDGDDGRSQLVDDRHYRGELLFFCKSWRTVVGIGIRHRAIRPVIERVDSVVAGEAEIRETGILKQL